ncbi:MAG: STY4851/ECs_5259 family protein, partial [Lysobacterales bacterium]
MVSETMLWHAEFYFKRGIRGSTGRPLYSYRVAEKEFVELKDALRVERISWDDPALRDYWAACYSMYVAESYRRHYDPATGWTWAAFDGPLGLSVSVSEKRLVVLNGLRYWGRPVRRFENGNHDYLGSLFAEGGLPWTLLNAPVHGFGRAVRSGVRHFDEDRESARSVATRIAEFRPYFPQSFRTDEVGLLLAGIVSQLISIVERCRLRLGEDPIAVLDRDMPTWRDDFPIPLDDVNANQLISDWLAAARQGREDWAKRSLDRSTRCAHRLPGNTTNLDAVISIVELQHQVVFPIPVRGLTSTRLELCCYEGDRLAQRLGVAYASQDGDVIRITSPKASIEVCRDNVDVPLSLKVLDAGEIIHSLPVPNSSFDGNVDPTVFEFRDDSWWFLSAVTCNTKADRVRIRMPAGWEAQSGQALTLVAEDQAIWIEASAALSLVGFGEEIRVGFSDNGVSSYRLAGAVPMEGARPELVALGWPRIERDGAGDAEANLVHFVNGRSRQALAGNQDFGTIKYQLRTTTGLTIFRKRFGLLPADFRVRLSPASGARPARLAVTSRESLVLTVAVGSGEPASWNHVTESMHDLPNSPGLGRSEVNIAVHSRGNPYPVVLRRPYPLVGVQVTKADGTRICCGALRLEDLPGMEAVFYAGPGGDTFRVVLELVGIRGATPSQYSTLRVGDEPVRIHVNSYAEDIAMLLGVSSDQDARVRISFESGVTHCTFEVCRYKYDVLRLQEDSAVIEIGRA